MVHQSKPVIGINADFRPEDGAVPAISFVFSGYYDSILKAGGLPVIIPPYSDAEDMEQLLNMLDGVVMVGGADLDPRRDGFMLHPSIRLMNERREKFDRTLISKIAERKIPVFGIGSGMQLLNVSQGGTLFLHIPEDISKALPHRDTMDPYHRHGLTVLKDSLLARVYGDNEIRVNSRHHMAIDDVAPRFLVTARSPDKVIEAIEYMDDDWFAIGTQFHPETISATVLDQRIFVEFVRGVIDFKQQHKHTAAPSKHTIAAKEETKTGTKSVAAKKHEKSMPLFMDEPVTVKVSSRKYAAAKL